MKNFERGEPINDQPFQWKFHRFSITIFYWELWPVWSVPENDWSHEKVFNWLCFEIEWKRMKIYDFTAIPSTGWKDTP